jgi:Tfp pilus assembly protein PilF
MDRCPICRAALNGAATCRRCRAELARPQALESRATAMTGAAMYHLAQGETAQAELLLRRAMVLHAAPSTSALWAAVAARAEA